jgi:hypothetical protein
VALPLSWWILGAIAAGALTTLAITFLVGLSNYFTKQGVRSQFRAASRRSASESSSRNLDDQYDTAAAAAASRSSSADVAGDEAWQDWRGYKASPQSSTSATKNQATPRDQTQQADDLDDWERGISDDWEEASPPPSGDRPNPAPTATAPPKRGSFERQQQPKQATRSGSSYSYSYREPGASGVGKTESVVDADFRVLVPPYKPLIEEPTPAPLSNDPDSWFDDEEGEENLNNRRSR